MRTIDEQFLATPWYGSRQMARQLRRQGHGVGRKRVRRLMRQMGLTAIYRKPQTSSPDGSHRIYPYRLGHLRIERPNQVWCADVTYIPMQRGFLYLVAIMDWATRTVLSWRLSNTQDSAFCREALREALARYGRPEIFNTDQGSQFTSREFTEVLEQAGVAISMDGKGRWMDNVFIERLWRSLKYECVYLHDFQDGRAGASDDRGLASLVQRRAASFQPGRRPDAYGRIHPAQGGMNREGGTVWTICQGRVDDPAPSKTAILQSRKGGLRGLQNKKDRAAN